MKRKTGGTIFFLACCMVIFALTMAYAGDDRKCEKCAHSFDRKVLKRIHLVIENQDALEASDSQIEKLKELKMRLKKDLIQRKAAIDLIGVDIKSKLWADDIDRKDINELIDRKYELKKAKAKSVVEAWIELKDILKDEQEAKLKDIMQHSRRMQHRCY